MPTIRIDPGARGNRKRVAVQNVGATAGAALFGAFGSAAGAKIGDMLGGALFRKEPVFPIEIDTETNKLRLLAPDPTQSINRKTKTLAPRITALNSAVESALQGVWDTGTISAQVPKRYRDVATEIISQRALLRVEAEPAPASPAITEGAQYTGTYSMAGIVPPGGFAGFAQMTPASKAAQGFGKLLGSAKRYTSRIGRKKRKKRAGGKRKRKASGKRKGRKLVKGSAAAKRFMANLRRKRK